MADLARPTDPITSYAVDVIEGRVITGKLVRLACERHLRDLEQADLKGLRWDANAARAALDFWALCPHIKGKWADTPIKLEPWQAFIVGSVFGWKRLDGYRRFRVVWVEVARKNGKTTLLYPAALHGLAVDGEPGGEVYACATKRDQAKLVFQLARRAVIKSADLLELITPYAYSLECEYDGTKFEPLGADADTLDGLNPSVVIADEVHRWKGRALWDVIETGMGARAQPLLWAITTAGDEGDADCYGQEHEYSCQVLRGVIEDEARFAYIACLDPEDDWTDARNFVKANPNLGVSVRSEEIADAVAKAGHSPAARSAVKRLRLGLRTQSAEAWIPLERWDKLRGDVSLGRMLGYPTFIGLDLASSCDFAAACFCFPLDTSDDGSLLPANDLGRPSLYGLSWRLWMPAEARTAPEVKLRELVRPWADLGWITLTEGDVIDHDKIEEDLLAEVGRLDLQGLAYDPFNAAQLATHLQKEGIEVHKFPQTMAGYAHPTTRFDELLHGGRLRHDGNPVIRWMCDNCVLLSNAAGHRMPSRKRSKNKIDGIMAGVMALGRALAAEGGGSFYDKPGAGLI